jgi:hypothetical protein
VCTVLSSSCGLGSYLCNNCLMVTLAQHWHVWCRVKNRFGKSVYSRECTFRSLLYLIFILKSIQCAKWWK